MSKRGDSSLADWLRASLTTPVEPERREEVLLAQQWGVASCAECGRTILLGEKSVRLRIDRQPVTICSLCAVDKAKAYRRAA